MHAAGAAGLGPASQAEFLKKGVGLKGNFADVIPAHTRTGVEIDPQFVRMVKVICAYGVGVQLDAAEIDDPCKSGSIVQDNFLGGSSRREGERHGAQP
jgi:hypothetical protein